MNNAEEHNWFISISFTEPESLMLVHKTFSSPRTLAVNFSDWWIWIHLVSRHVWERAGKQWCLTAFLENIVLSGLAPKPAVPTLGSHSGHSLSSDLWGLWLRRRRTARIPECWAPGQRSRETKHGSQQSVLWLFVWRIWCWGCLKEGCYVLCTHEKRDFSKVPSSISYLHEMFFVGKICMGLSCPLPLGKTDFPVGLFWPNPSSGWHLYKHRWRQAFWRPQTPAASRNARFQEVTNKNRQGLLLGYLYDEGQHTRHNGLTILI